MIVSAPSVEKPSAGRPSASVALTDATGTTGTSGATARMDGQWRAKRAAAPPAAAISAR